MPKQLQRLRQIRKPDDYNDQLSSTSITTSENDSVHLDDALSGVLSQIKRIIHGDESGNWHDDFISDFGGDASLRNLFQSAGGRVSELLTYTNVTNKIIGPLAVDPSNESYTDLNITTGPQQEYTLDYTVREVVGGSSPGYYICISPTSTAPGGGSFSGGNNPGTGIESVLENGDKVRATYTV